MNAISLRRFAPAARDDDEISLAAPSLSPDDRVLLWQGFPPLHVEDHRAIAPVVLDGELDGRRTYGEQVPKGVQLAEHVPPPELLFHVAAEILSGLAALHREGQVHGAVVPENVFLGLQGEVVLAGRGRLGGVFGTDVLAAIAFALGEEDFTVTPSSAENLAKELAEQAPPDARERLAAFVAECYREPVVAEQIVVISGAQRDAVDEVVPDLGPESDARGILDRWAVSTSGGHTNEEITDEIFSTQQTLGLTLWRRLSSPAEHPPPPERFDRVAGLPSRGVRTILTEEPPDVLPLPLLGSVGDFVLPEPTWDDQPTVARPLGDLNTDEVPLGNVIEKTAHEITATVASITELTQRPRVPVWAQWIVAMALGGLLVWVALRIFGSA